MFHVVPKAFSVKYARVFTAEMAPTFSSIQSDSQIIT